MANTTMTYAQAIDNALAILTDEATKTRLTELKEALAKRGSKGGMTKTQKENEKVKEVILEVLTNAEDFVTMAELTEEKGLEGLSTQKVGSLMKQLITDNKAQKVVYKKKTFYAVAGIEWVDPTPIKAEDETEGEEV